MARGSTSRTRRSNPQRLADDQLAPPALGDGDRAVPGARAQEGACSGSGEGSVPVRDRNLTPIEVATADAGRRSHEGGSMRKVLSVWATAVSITLLTCGVAVADTLITTFEPP
jgi:hypothetical protein